jgi:hypothetical protein
MPTYTSKYGLIKPTPGNSEVVNVADLNANSDVIDSRLGATVVTDGVTPDTTTLREGQLVVERTSGIAWVAQKDNTGAYIKNYVNYPYYYAAFMVASIPADSTWNQFGWPTWSPSSYNATAADMGGGPSANYWKAPFKGIFSFRCIDLFGPGSAALNQFRASLFSTNGALEENNSLAGHYMLRGNNLTNVITMTKVYNTGDVLGHSVYVDSVGNPTLTSTVFVTCIQRLG